MLYGLAGSFVDFCGLIVALLCLIGFWCCRLGLLLWVYWFGPITCDFGLLVLMLVGLLCLW